MNTGPSRLSQNDKKNVLGLSLKPKTGLFSLHTCDYLDSLGDHSSPTAKPTSSTMLSWDPALKIFEDSWTISIPMRHLNFSPTSTTTWRNIMIQK